METREQEGAVVPRPAVEVIFLEESKLSAQSQLSTSQKRFIPRRGKSPQDLLLKTGVASIVAVACALVFLVYTCRSLLQDRLANSRHNGGLPALRRLSEWGGGRPEDFTGAFGWQTPEEEIPSHSASDEADQYCFLEFPQRARQGDRSIRKGELQSEQDAEHEGIGGDIVSPVRSRFKRSGLGIQGVGRELRVAIPSPVELEDRGSSLAAQVMCVVRESLRNAQQLTVRLDTLRGNAQQRCRYARRILNNIITLMVSLPPQEAALVVRDQVFIAFAARLVRVIDIQLFMWTTMVCAYEEGIVSQAQRTQVRATDLRELLINTTERVGSRPSSSDLRVALNDLRAQWEFATAYCNEARTLYALQNEIAKPGLPHDRQVLAYVDEFPGVMVEHLKALMFPSSLLECLEEIHRSARSFPGALSNELVEMLVVELEGVSEEIQAASQYNVRLSSPAVVAAVVTVCSRIIFAVRQTPRAQRAVEQVIRTAFDPDIKVLPRRVALMQAVDNATQRIQHITATSREIREAVSASDIQNEALQNWIRRRIVALKNSLGAHRTQMKEDIETIIRSSSHDNEGPTQAAIGMWRRMRKRWLRSQEIAVRSFEGDYQKTHEFFPISWQPALNAAVIQTVFGRDEPDSGDEETESSSFFREEGACGWEKPASREEGATPHSFLFLGSDSRWAPSSLSEEIRGTPCSSFSERAEPLTSPDATHEDHHDSFGLAPSEPPLTVEMFMDYRLRIPGPWTAPVIRAHKASIRRQLELEETSLTGRALFETREERKQWLLSEVKRLLLPSKKPSSAQVAGGLTERLSPRTPSKELPGSSSVTSPQENKEKAEGLTPYQSGSEKRSAESGINSLQTKGEQSGEGKLALLKRRQQAIYKESTVHQISAPAPTSAPLESLPGFRERALGDGRQAFLNWSTRLRGQGNYVNPQVSGPPGILGPHPEREPVHPPLIFVPFFNFDGESGVQFNQPTYVSAAPPVPRPVDTNQALWGGFYSAFLSSPLRYAPPPYTTAPVSLTPASFIEVPTEGVGVGSALTSTPRPSQEEGEYLAEDLAPRLSQELSISSLGYSPKDERKHNRDTD